MKAVVLEIRDGFAAVLREDGTVERLRRDCRVGDTIELEEKGRVVSLRAKAVRWTAAAAAALIILSGGTYGYNNAYAYSYVTMDVNPSIEYVLNRNNRVLRVEALNEDGEELAAALNDAGIRRATLTEAMDETTRLLYEEQYLGGEDDSIYISVRSRGENQRETLTEEVDAYFTAREDESLTVYVTDAPDGDGPAADGGPSGTRVIGGPGSAPASVTRQRPAEDGAEPSGEPAGREGPASGQEPARQEPQAAERRTESGTDARTGPQPDAQPDTQPDAQAAPDGAQDVYGGTAPNDGVRGSREIPAMDAASPEAPGVRNGGATPEMDGAGPAPSGEPS